VNGGGLELTDEEIARINPFDWQAEFKDVFKQGGFDAVIGNPPYVFGRDWKELGIGEVHKRYFKECYSWSPYQLDMFSLFMELAHRVCKDGGAVGQIVPNVWLTNTYSVVTRSSLIQSSSNIVLALPVMKVFPTLTVDTIVYTLCRLSKSQDDISLSRLSPQTSTPQRTLSRNEYSDGSKSISFASSSQLSNVLKRSESHTMPLGAIAEITRGVHPYRTGGYGKSAYENGPQTQKDVDERPYHSKKILKNYRPFIYGKDLKRFTPLVAREYVKYGEWLAEPRDPKFFEEKRIYSRKILGDRLVLTVENEPSVADQQVYITKLLNANLDVSYVAGILGSVFTKKVISETFDETEQAFPQIKVSQLRQLPIRTINFKDKADKARHDKMVKLVERLLELNKKLPEVKVPGEREKMERQIAATDREIDLLVYELYGLTAEEIAIVEGRPHPPTPSP